MVENPEVDRDHQGGGHQSELSGGWAHGNSVILLPKPALTVRRGVAGRPALLARDGRTARRLRTSEEQAVGLCVAAPGFNQGAA